MIRAIVYVPLGIERACQLAREGIDHIDRRGYRFGGVFPTMDDIRRALRDGAAMVIFARQSHWDPEMQVPAEIVGEETRRLSWGIPPKDRLADRRPIGEQTEEIDTRAAVTPRRRPRNDRAAQLVEEYARQLGFPPSYRQGPAHY